MISPPPHDWLSGNNDRPGPCEFSAAGQKTHCRVVPLGENGDLVQHHVGDDISTSAHTLILKLHPRLAITSQHGIEMQNDPIAQKGDAFVGLEGSGDNLADGVCLCSAGRRPHPGDHSLKMRPRV